MELTLIKDAYGFKRGEVLKILSSKYNSSKNGNEYLVRLQDEQEIYLDSSYFRLPKLRFLGCHYSFGEKIKFKVKSINELMASGWKLNEKGQIYNSEAFYKFTKNKKKAIDQVITGTIGLNPKNKACVKDLNNGWNFDESMIVAVIKSIDPYVPFKTEVANVLVKGYNDGGMIIGDFRFREKEVQELLKLILKYHNWIVE